MVIFNQVMDVKYYDEILDLGVFSKKDIEKVIQNPKTAESFLSRSLKKGYIKRVKHNYYVAMDIVNNSPLYNKYIIATKLDRGNYISYHSALEYRGFNNQVFNELVYSGNNRVNDFEFEYITYHFVQSKCDLQIESNHDGLRITSVERTMIDCIDQIDLAGGIEEIYRAFNSIHNINENKLLEILDFYNKKVLYQRSGYILETFKTNLGISDAALNYLQSKIGSSKCYLNTSKKIPNTTLDKKWNVCVPHYISTILSKGSDMNEL